ncbi:MAG: hypothetical protein Kow0090_09600 [Myxococcota bacterium]
MAKETVKSRVEKKGNGRVNLSDEVKSRLEKVSEELIEFQDTQRKKMEEFVESYLGKLQKFREELETKTSESLSQLSSHLKFATKEDVEGILTRLEAIDRKLNKLSKELKK